MPPPTAVPVATEPHAPAAAAEEPTVPAKEPPAPAVEEPTPDEKPPAIEEPPPAPNPFDALSLLALREKLGSPL